MDLVYHSTILTYERKGNRVMPVRIRKEWIEDARTKQRKFVVVRASVQQWRQLSPLNHETPEPWWSVRVNAPTRASLLAAGIVRELGAGLPCLRLLA